MKRLLLSWSSGKDSAWALHILRQSAEYEIAGLLTTFNESADRVAMHAVRRELVEQQANAAALPLRTIPLPWACSNEQYESLMSQVCRDAVAQRIDCIAFGDLFLTDVRAYRERQLYRKRPDSCFSVVATADGHARARYDRRGTQSHAHLRRSPQT
jgi:diphthamide synthase (EF-2-diphthine--ammonia ligase)